MKIKNSSSLFSQNQIKEILKLLPKEVQQIESDLYIFSSISEAKKELSFFSNHEDYWNKVFEKKIYGTTWDSPSLTALYPFNFEEPDLISKQLQFIFTLFHEKRHHYQIHHFPDLIDKEFYQNHTDKQNSLEQDANWHAAHWMKEKQEDINKILNISSKWNVRIMPNSAPISEEI